MHNAIEMVHASICMKTITRGAYQLHGYIGYEIPWTDCALQSIVSDHILTGLHLRRSRMQKQLIDPGNCSCVSVSVLCPR